MRILFNRHDGSDDLLDVRLGTVIRANQKYDPPLVAVAIRSRPVGGRMFA
jgi:hypothetical protein